MELPVISAADGNFPKAPTNPTRFQPTEGEILEKPWKYVGYDGYSKFLASDDDFMVFRRFGTLNTRIALVLQDKVSVLEEKLVALDTRYSQKEMDDFHNGTLRDELPDREIVIDDIVVALHKYNDFMLQQTILRKLPEVPDRNVQSVVNWHYNHDFNAIAPDEQSYLSHTGDLFSLVQKSVSPIRHLVNSSERLRTLSLWRYQKEDAPEYDTKQVLYYSDKRIDAFDSAFIFFLGAAMLVAPIWILQTLDVLQAKLGVITAFIVLFLAMMSYAIHTKPFEALGATAAYAAVLMVFIQFGTRES